MAYDEWQDAKPDEPARLVQFGEGKHQAVTQEIMEKMFRDLFANHKITFALLMAHAYGMDDTDIAPPAARGGRRRAGDASG